MKRSLDADVFFMSLVKNKTIIVFADGTVYNTKTHSYIGYNCGDTDYRILSMYNSEKRKSMSISINRLVWLRFNGHLELHELIVNKDGDHSNNHLNNLIKVTRATRSSQLKYHHIEKKYHNKFGTKMSAPEIIRKIRHEYNSSRVSQRDLGKQYDLTDSEISKILNKKTYKDVI